MEPVKYDRYERFCMRQCHSIEHADEISAAILRGNEEQAISFMSWRCSNYAHVTDEAGRTALHVAAASGKVKVVEWILKVIENESFVNAKDYESGYTPLHRSLFHGQLSAARCLIKHGAKLTPLDNDGLMPLDHLMRDRPTEPCSPAVPCEVYVWGRNMNFNLGVGDNEIRRFPDTVDYFRRNNISIVQVSMGKFHSVFVSSDGRAFSCGHGKERLGLNSEETFMLPKQIFLHSDHEAAKIVESKHVVISASVGQDHSLLLTSKGNIYSFGLNCSYQLGLDPPLRVQHTPKQLKNIPPTLIGIKAARYHSLAWSSSMIYTWGSNFGQLGHSRDEKWVVFAKRVPQLRGGNFVTASTGNSATVVGTSHGDIYILQNYVCRKIGSMLGLPRRIEVVGGRLDPALIKSEDVSAWGEYRSGEDELYVVMLNESKKLAVWRSSDAFFTRCNLQLGNRAVLAVDIALCINKLLVVTEEGEGFETELKLRKRREDALDALEPMTQTTLKKGVEKDKSLHFQMNKIPYIHRAKSVYCSPKGFNFSIIQGHPAIFLKRPQAEKNIGLEAGLHSLLEKADESDCISDIVLNVLGIRIPAHRYILESGSKILASLINSAEKMQNSLLEQSSAQVNGTNITKKLKSMIDVTIEGINPVIFKEILRYIYTGKCDMLMLEWSSEKDKEYLDFASLLKEVTQKVSQNICEDKGNILNENVPGKKLCKGRSRLMSGSDESESNPVNDARIAACYFELEALAKQLDNLQYHKAKGKIQKKLHLSSSIDEKTISRTPLSPYSCTHLYDIIIECDGAKIINAHKCVLAMRSKYFETMLKGNWIECTGLKNVTLPFSFEVMEAIIIYLYQNKVPAVYKSNDLAYIWTVLIASDQILLEELKEICEVVLTNHVTLKNVSDFYQMSDTYNAVKLKQFCLEYICANLSALLECRALDDIDPELFDDLQLHYWTTNPAVLNRQISPPSEYPNSTVLQNIPKEVRVPNEEEHIHHSESILRGKVIDSTKRSRTKRKQKSRTTVDEKAGQLSRLSLGSNSGPENDLTEEACALSLAELSICEPFDKCLHITCKDESVKDIRPPSEETSWVGPGPCCHKQSPSSVTVLQGNTAEEDFPMLSSDAHQGSASTSSKAFKNRRMTRLSQKERKRQLSSSVPKPTSENGDCASKPEVNPWRRLSGSSHEGSLTQPESPSLSEIMDEERRHRATSRKLFCDKRTSDENKTKRPPMWRLSVECSPDSPHANGGRSGGWPTTPSAKQQAVGPKPFSEIMADEIKQREMTKRMMEKPLNFTLMEDRAIKELQTVYNREHEHDERIDVKRVSSAQAAKPVWLHSRHS